MHQRVLCQLAIELRDFLLPASGAGFLQCARRIDGARPFLFALIDFKHGAARLGAVLRVGELVEGFLGAVQQAGLEVVLTQLVARVHHMFLCQVGARQQVLVHADGTLCFTAAAKQVTQGEVHFHRLGVELDDFDERIDRLVRLLIEQEIESLEIAKGKAARLGHQLANIHARGNPAEREQHGYP